MPESYWDKLVKAAKHAVGGKMMNTILPGSTAAYNLGDAIGNGATKLADSKNPEVIEFTDGTPAFVEGPRYTNAFGPTSIPGLRPATVNGEPVSETELLASKYSNAAGKSIAERFPGLSEKAQAAAAAIEKLKAAQSDRWAPNLIAGPVVAVQESSPGMSLQEYINKKASEARKKDGLDIEVEVD